MSLSVAMGKATTTTDKLQLAKPSAINRFGVPTDGDGNNRTALKTINVTLLRLTVLVPRL